MTLYMLGGEWTRYETQLELICEVLLYRVMKEERERLTPRKRKFRSINDTCDYQLVQRQRVNLAHFNGQNMGERVSLTFPENDFDHAGDNIEDLILSVCVYAEDCKTWPPTMSNVVDVDGGRGKQYNVVREMLNGMDRDRMLWVQMSLLDDGEWINDGVYEWNMMMTEGHHMAVPSSWKMDVSLEWDVNCHSNLRPVEESLPLTYWYDVKGPEFTVTYNYRVADCEQSAKYRGYRCPWCTGYDFYNVTCLLSHLRNAHVHLKFTCKIPKQPPPTDINCLVTYNEDNCESDYFLVDDKDRLLVPKPFEYPLIQYSAPRVELPLNNCYHS
ncbi:3377_t:CDS:2, partial [Paraglomus occultum]